jgi:hypothetical protein
MDVSAWLLDSDPALRWQVERDLLGAPAEVWEATRARVGREGIAAEVLARQDPDGQWAGGAYFPADASRDEPGQPWTATTWTLNALREWGTDAALLGDTAARLAANSRWEYQDLPYWGGEVDCCINGFTVANGLWLGADVRGIVEWFPGHRMADGGWNCLAEEDPTASDRSSFHSTLNALGGLLAWDEAAGGRSEARRTGEEYLLVRGLLHRLSTGERVGPWVSDLRYPFRWTYTALRAADHFRRATLLDGGPPDPRIAGAVELVRAARLPDGTWPALPRDPGRQWCEIEDPEKWITFHALRVLRWWDAA